MDPSLMQTISQIAIVVGTVIATGGGFGAYYYGKQVDLEKRNDTTTNQVLNITSYNQSGGITAQNVIVLDNEDIFDVGEVLSKINKDHEELTDCYTKLSKTKIEKKHFPQLKEIVLNMVNEFELNKLNDDYESYQNKLFQILSILVKNFPMEIFTDRELRITLINYDSWFVLKSTKKEKFEFEKNFVKYISTSEVQDNKGVILTMFSLIECEPDLNKAYETFISDLKSELKKDKLVEILKIGTLKRLRKYNELKKELL
jgi:hypothetical protein